MVVDCMNEGSYCSFGSCSYSNSSQILKVKTCSCSVGKELCPSHSATITDRSSQSSYFRYNNTDTKNSHIDLSHRTNSTCTQSSVTVIAKIQNPSTSVFDELKLSLASLTSDQDVEDDKEIEKERAFQRWLAEKNRLRKEELQKKEEIQKFILSEKEKKLEQERLSFASWLKTKKRKEKMEQNINYSQKQKQEKKLLEEKEQKQKFAQMKINLWFKQKEEQELLHKMQEQLNKIKAEEEKQRRMKISTEAYENWLKNCKNKPKPIPLNQGLDSLRTSVSVSYINPIPWVPNIDCSKPATK